MLQYFYQWDFHYFDHMTLSHFTLRSEDHQANLEKVIDQMGMASSKVVYIPLQICLDHSNICTYMYMAV